MPRRITDENCCQKVTVCVSHLYIPEGMMSGVTEETMAGTTRLNPCR